MSLPDIPVLSQNNPSSLCLRWVIYEEIGETVVYSEPSDIWNGCFYEKPQGRRKLPWVLLEKKS